VVQSGGRLFGRGRQFFSNSKNNLEKPLDKCFRLWYNNSENRILMLFPAAEV